MNGLHEMTLAGLKNREDFRQILVATGAACLVAASDSSLKSGMGLAGLYAYWLVRIYIESILFISFRQILRQYLPAPMQAIPGFLLAALVSLFPFVLAITAYDLILGQPELGLDGPVRAGVSHVEAYFLELLYLSDNHLALCLLLSMASWGFAVKADKTDDDQEDNRSPVLPDLDGQILWVEAQEHYVRITTTRETRTMLYRFSDLVRQLGDKNGMQVHRSHWVAWRAVDKTFRKGQSTRALLTTGDEIPVSRTWRAALETALAEQT